jgi:hypothetical protein
MQCVELTGKEALVQTLIFKQRRESGRRKEGNTIVDMVWWTENTHTQLK